MVSVELDFPLKGRHVLSVNLEGERPESTLPNETGFGILESQVILIINALRCHAEVEVSNVEPEGYNEYGSN